ncbi:C4-type zinc ribbon domain-containing protein [Desulfobacula sp.]|uniref:zinc ribbon domain-containing protein n=1 Tax=Desulfobacula sp. TaxID=2593537 RepID=UPI00261CAF19|nr:C4-type zinc ribbon domain-containing protein [Desulfobacula sp.]
MNDISKPELETLVKLQEAETQIVRLKAVLEKVEKEKIKLSAKLKQFGNALEDNEKNLLKARTACRDIEQEIQVVDQRIIKSNEKLRMVKTNKEYQLFLREVDDSKQRKDALETELLEHMDEREKMEQIVQASEKEYHLLKDQIEAEQTEMDQQSTDDREQLEEYLDQQNDIGKHLDPALMKRFLRISKMNQGLAVVGVSNEVCLGCFMNIPPQLFIDVQRGDSLISCPQCSRILYYVKE